MKKNLKRNSVKRNLAKRHSTKRNSAKRNFTKRNSAKRNFTKRNYLKYAGSGAFTRDGAERAAETRQLGQAELSDGSLVFGSHVGDDDSRNRAHVTYHPAQAGWHDTSQLHVADPKWTGPGDGGRHIVAQKDESGPHAIVQSPDGTSHRVPLDEKVRDNVQKLGRAPSVASGCSHMREAAKGWTEYPSGVQRRDKKGWWIDYDRKWVNGSGHLIDKHNNWIDENGYRVRSPHYGRFEGPQY